MTTDRGVRCILPDHEDYPDRTNPPEGYDEWRAASGICNHDYCIEGDYYGRLYARAPREPSRGELAEMNADLELIMDETHGRGFGR